MPDEAAAATSRLPTARIGLVTKVARMYHEQGIRQPEIAARLSISQSRVSRLLKEAVNLGVVRTVVVPPPGVHSDLEEAVRTAYGLSDVVVADALADDEPSILNALGAAGAAYLETTLTGRERLGVSSWSATLLAVVDAMLPRTVRTAESVVQVLGGVGNARVQVRAQHLTERLARVTGAAPMFLPAPGVVTSEAVRDALLQDEYVAEVVEAWSSLTVLLVGIGSLEPSPLLKDSGNTVSPEEMESLRGSSAVGDVCLRFYDQDGGLVPSSLNGRVVGISVDELRAVPRKVGVAGGARKRRAIRAAALGGWIDVLITDVGTAEYLVDAASAPGRA
jgi:DNA-binding transcriptional regulator LsrR (DeoR family)